MSVIGVDVDGVLADFSNPYQQRMAEVTGVDLWKGTVSDSSFPTVWDYDLAQGYTPAQVSATWKSIKKDLAFWVLLPPRAGAEDALRRLSVARDSGRDDIYFITARIGASAKLQTESWLASHGFENPTVIISPEKGIAAAMLRFDAYIDDRLRNANEVMQVVRGIGLLTRVYLDDAPYNRSQPVLALDALDIDPPSDHAIDPALIRVSGIAEMLQKEGM